MIVILAVALTLAAAGAGVAVAEVCYPDLVCGRCGAILPGGGHECSEGR